MRVAACLVSQVHVCMLLTPATYVHEILDVVSLVWLWFNNWLQQRPSCRCLHVFLPAWISMHVGVVYLVLISSLDHFASRLHISRRMKAHLSSVAACNRLLVWTTFTTSSVFSNGLALTCISSCASTSSAMRCRFSGPREMSMCVAAALWICVHHALWKVHLRVAHSGCSLATARHGSLL